MTTINSKLAIERIKAAAVILEGMAEHDADEGFQLALDQLELAINALIGIEETE